MTSFPASADQSPTSTTHIASLVEWHASSMTQDQAMTLAAETIAAFRRIPGIIEIRSFGDFETGIHYYLQVWEDRAALDAYMASESMFKIREIAEPYLDGRPSRRLLVDYSVR